MIYEFPFAYDGKRYFFRGEKFLANDWYFDFWKDSTTLYCKLYEGDSTMGRVAGSGILRVTIPEIIKLLDSAYAINVPTLGGQWRVKLGFALFFIKNLASIYSPFRANR
ncbi:MAG: hypothetical protein OEZ04_06480 [Nitrospinota bacterium]|nr:hypothetical protein [Nitrospinota bacterium]